MGFINQQTNIHITGTSSTQGIDLENPWGNPPDEHAASWWRDSFAVMGRRTQPQGSAASRRWPYMDVLGFDGAVSWESPLWNAPSSWAKADFTRCFIWRAISGGTSLGSTARREKPKAAQGIQGTPFCDASRGLSKKHAVCISPGCSIPSRDRQSATRRISS